MRLTPHDIAKMLDHSTLQPFLTDEDIRKGCELALRYDTASVCARPCDMPLVASLLRGSDVKVCTVIGFPHGTHRTAIKVAEAKQALADGCTELDMVINIGKPIRFEDMGLTEDSGMIYRRVSRNIFAEVQKLREEGLDIMENRWKEV